MLKAYQIALYVFILNLTVMLFAQMPLFGSAFPVDSFETNFTGNFTYTFNSTNSTYYLAYDDELVETANFSGYQASGIDEFGIIEILVMFGTALWNSTVYLPWFIENTLTGLGMGQADANVIKVFITAPVWFVYGAGVFQIVRGLIFED